MVLILSRSVSSPNAHHLLRRVRNGEERPGCTIHTFVRGLCRQHDGYEQRIRVHIMKFALRFRIGGMEAAEDLLDVLEA